jgi:hypothetical protein
MTQIFTIENNRVVITKLALNELEGNVTQTGDLSVNGTLTVDRLIVNNPDSAEEKTNVEFGRWIGIQEEEINGKGFNWTWGQGGLNLFYRDGGRLWTDGDFDLDRSRSYKIDNTPVLSVDTLGPTITKSNLRQVGPLKSLNVIGDTRLSEFAFFNSGFGRLGINTEEPNSAIGILENDVEIVVGSQEYGSASIGTYSNSDLKLITDNTDRIVIKNNGEINLLGKVKINGTLEVETIVSDTRIDRYSPLEFKSTRDVAIYGRGLVWTGTGDTRQFIMMAGPDRLWSTESLDLATNQSYYINNTPVLSERTLGPGVVNSSLNNVGVLESLTVGGVSRFEGNINAENALAQFKSVAFKNHLGELNISSTGFSSTLSVSIKVANSEVFYSDNNEIVIGDKALSRRPVKVNGPLSVGISNPDSDVDLAVKGNIGFANRKFISGNEAPTQGTYDKGDICWNNSPQSDNYVGWVCVAEGAPGTWLPFGAIARQ